MKTSLAIVPPSLIKIRFDEALREANEFVLAFPWEDQEAYAAWVAQQYFLVSHTARLLALAISKTEDPRVRNEFIQHLAGERGHDDILLKDLAALGHKVEQFQPYPSTRLLIHNQYYWIQNTSADCLFGYAQYLEGISIFTGPKVIERLKACGQKAIAFLQLHVESDEDHYPEGLERIQRIGPAAETLILPNLAESHLLYGRMFSDIATNASQARAAA